jgi:hypothetical protein
MNFILNGNVLIWLNLFIIQEIELRPFKRLKKKYNSQL